MAKVVIVEKIIKQEITMNNTSQIRLTLYSDVGTSVSYGSFKVITPETPSSFKRATSAGNGTAPNKMN